MSSAAIPPGAVIRVSRAEFDPATLADVERMTHETGEYLIPAIRQLDGLFGYYVGVAAEGSTVHISVWQSNDHANQMGRLKEMIVDARNDAEAVGVHFLPIINHPVAWHI